MITAFIADYEETAIVLSATKTREALDRRANKLLLPLIDKWFSDSMVASNLIVKKEIALLVDSTGVPFKYNKEVIDKLNSNSVFQGYYDKNYKGLFKKREIDALKRKILQGVYADPPWSDKRFISEIQKTVNISKNRALTTARMETQRLKSSAIDIYYQKAAVKKNYNKVYRSLPDARPTHKALNYQIADEEGYFTNVNGVKFKTLPEPDSPFGCRCWVELVKKPIE